MRRSRLRARLTNAGLTLKDIDLFEVNEAFAVVAEKFIRDLSARSREGERQWRPIALGHPIGATGVILIGTLLDELDASRLEAVVGNQCVPVAAWPPRSSLNEYESSSALLEDHLRNGVGMFAIIR